MAITDELKKRALQFSGQAMERLLADEKRATQIAQAMGAVQRSKQAIDEAQAQLLNTLGFASKQDYKDLGKKMSSLKRRARELAQKLEKLA